MIRYKIYVLADCTHESSKLMTRQNISKFSSAFRHCVLKCDVVKEYKMFCITVYMYFIPFLIIIPKTIEVSGQLGKYATVKAK